MFCCTVSFNSFYTDCTFIIYIFFIIRSALQNDYNESVIPYSMRIKKFAAFKNGISQELPDGGSSNDKKRSWFALCI